MSAADKPAADTVLEFADQRMDEYIERIATSLERIASEVRQNLGTIDADTPLGKSRIDVATRVLSAIGWGVANLQTANLVSNAGLADAEAAKVKAEQTASRIAEQQAENDRARTALREAVSRGDVF